MVNPRRTLLLSLWAGLGLWLGGCRSPAVENAASPLATVDGALEPAQAVRALGRLGGVYFQASTHFGAQPQGAPGDQITTTTELWLDDRGHYRLLETNDAGGAREVVLFGDELAVSVGEGKRVRRKAESPEPERYLREAVGGPFAAWELLRSHVSLDPLPERNVGGRAALGFRLGPTAHRAIEEGAAEGAAAGASPQAKSDLRRWRQTLHVESSSGELWFDKETRAPVQIDVAARYRFLRDGKPMTGELRVKAAADKAQAQLVAEPEAVRRPTQQRTVLEEKALLEGLGGWQPPKGGNND